VRVGDFTAAQPGRTEITCRAVGPIKTPYGESFEAFIRKALIDELRIAEIYSETVRVTLTGRLDSLDFSSGLTDAASLMPAVQNVIRKVVQHPDFAGLLR
jgi:hypothetical protein